MVSNTVENIAIGAGSAAATYAAVEAWRRASERTVLDGKTVRSTRVDAARLSADADTFQFKSGGDRSGVTDRLAGVKTWNAAAAGKVMVYEYADGRQVIADGHQRTGLAKRLMSDGHAPIKMDALVLREADGWSPRDVRAYAAIKNMHESSGNALDMAKIMRERPDLVTSSLPMSDAKVREASALSRLSDKAFGMVVGGGVEPGAAAAVGEAVKDATRHADMIAEMSEAKVRGAQHARLYVQQALSAPSVAETTSSLFGEETHTRSLIKERSAVLDRALTSLKSNRKLFGMLEREADTIEAAGNKLARQANSSNADTAGRLSALVEKLATQRGNVSKMLDDAARAVASGEPAAKAGRAFLKSVQGAMEQGGIRALVGDAPLPMAASGGMQRMVEKQAKPQRSFVVHDIDGNTLEVFRSSKEAHAFALARNREQPVLNNSTKLWVREAAQSEVAPKGQSSFLPSPTTKEQITAAAKTAGKPGVMQQDVGGLFGDGMKQMDLVDEARKTAYTPKTNAEIVAAAELSPTATVKMMGIPADGSKPFVMAILDTDGDKKAAAERNWKGNAHLYTQKLAGYELVDKSGNKLLGWSDAAREAAAEARGVAKPGEAKAKPKTQPMIGDKKLAVAAGMDAGNRSMRAAGRTQWNADDANAATEARAKVMGETKPKARAKTAPKAVKPGSVADLRAQAKAAKAPPVAQLRADAARAGIPAAAQMKKPELMSLKKAGKFMGPLAIIGAGAVAFDATRNQAHAAGKSESAANLDAAGAAAIASGSVAAIGYGIGKVVQAAARVAPVAGKVLSRAVPAVAIAAAGYEIGKGAVAGFKKDGLAGAAKGAGVGAMDFATLGAYSHFANKGQMGRLTPEQEAQFTSADQGYRAGQEQQKAAATTDDSSGWTDQARIAAYMKRIANAGGTPQNMPYGGKPRQTPASSGTWAQANVAVPGGPAKGKN